MEAKDNNENHQRVGILRMNLDLLALCLGLPLGHRIVDIKGIDWTIHGSREVKLKIEGPEMPKVYEGSQIMYIEGAVVSENRPMIHFYKQED